MPTGGGHERPLRHFTHNVDATPVEFELPRARPALSADGWISGFPVKVGEWEAWHTEHMNADGALGPIWGGE